MFHRLRGKGGPLAGALNTGLFGFHPLFGRSYSVAVVFFPFAVSVLGAV